MLSKNKLRRLNPEQLAELATKDTEPSNLLLCQQFLHDRNDLLRSTKSTLVCDIAEQRQQIQKLIIELQDSMKEKLRLKERVVMSRDSRPGVHNMNKLSSTFTVTEKQNTINERKDQYISQLSQSLRQSTESKKQKISEQPNYSPLDSKFIELNKQCEAQSAVLEDLVRERDSHRAHYGRLGGQIEQCRTEYEEVEEEVRKAERQLIQLSSYLQDRKREDQQALQELAFRAGQLQDELLKGQDLVNSNRERRKFLQIQMIEVQGNRP